MIRRIAIIAALLSLASRASEPAQLQSFENGATEGWTLNHQGWANGFTLIENSTASATEGQKSLRVAFDGQSFRWGAYVQNITDPRFQFLTQFGGTFLLDVIAPAGATGLRNAGFAFEQPDVLGALNWQEIWFPITAPRTFTIQLPIQRTGAAAPTLHLGQNAVAGAGEFFIDNLRFIPNAPPTIPAFLPRSIILLSFFPGEPEFSLVANGAFTQIDVIDQKLRARTRAAQQQWGTTAAGLGNASQLSEIADGAVLIADVTIPTPGVIQEIGLSILQPDAQNPQPTQRWIDVRDRSGFVTIEVPFERSGAGAVSVSIGATATGEAEIFFDNFYFRIDEPIGAEPPSIWLDGANRRIEFTGQLETAAAIDQSFAPLQASSPFALTTAEPMRFFRARRSLLGFFSDNFELETPWSQSATEGSSPWRRAQLTGGHSGLFAFGTADTLAAGYAPNSFSSLLSPVIDLTRAPAARLFFYEILDIGGEEDTDIAAIYLRDENGAALPEIASPIYQASARNPTREWLRREIDLPFHETIRRIRLEFVFASDALENPGFGGWFIDDVQVIGVP